MTVHLDLGSETHHWPRDLTGRVQITRIFNYANDDSPNRPEAKKKQQRLRKNLRNHPEANKKQQQLRKYFVVKGELLAVEEGIRES